MDETKYKKETGYNEDAELRALLGGFDPQLPSDSLS